MTQGPSHDIGAEGTDMVDDTETWDDGKTDSNTPQADELRAFADEVERLERTVDDDAAVDPYYTGEKMRVSVVYPTDGVYPTDD